MLELQPPPSLSAGSSVEKCAKAALLQVLSQSTQSVDDDADYTFYGSLSKHDPLLNVHPPPPPPAALHRPETAPPTRSLRQVPDAGADVGRRVSVAVGAGRSRTFGRQTSVPPAAAPPAANKAHVRSASDIGVPVTRGGVVREEPDGCHDEAAEHESQDCKPDGSTGERTDFRFLFFCDCVYRKKSDYVKLYQILGEILSLYVYFVYDLCR